MAGRFETCDCGARDGKSDGAKYGLQFCACWSFTFDAGRFNQAIFTKSATCHFNGFQRVAANYWICLRRPIVPRLCLIYSHGAAYGDYLSDFSGRNLFRPSLRSARSVIRNVGAARCDGAPAFPLAVLLTLLLGWLCVWGERHNIFESAFGTALLASTLSVLFVILVTWTVWTVSNLELERIAANRALLESKWQLREAHDQM